MVEESLINPCACPIRRMKQQANSCSRSFLTNHLGLALGSAPTVGGGGGQGDRRRLSLRDSKCLPVVARHMVSLRVPRHCLRRVVACRSSPPASHTRCLHTSPADSRPPAARSACCLLAGHAPQVPFNILFKACRCAPPSDVTYAIAGVEIDAVGMAAGRRIASMMQSSAARPRSPRRVPCIPRALPIPRSRAGCAVCMLQVAAGGSQELGLGRSCARRCAGRSGQCEGRAVGRGEGAAARRSRRGERPGLAAVGAWDGWAAWRVRRATPLSRTAARSSVGMCARERP